MQGEKRKGGVDLLEVKFIVGTQQIVCLQEFGNLSIIMVNIEEDEDYK